MLIEVTEGKIAVCTYNDNSIKVSNFYSFYEWIINTNKDKFKIILLKNKYMNTLSKSYHFSQLDIFIFLKKVKNFKI